MVVLSKFGLKVQECLGDNLVSFDLIGAELFDKYTGEWSSCQ